MENQEIINKEVMMQIIQSVEEETKKAREELSKIEIALEGLKEMVRKS